ncbi:hypothetical protein [Thalassotalea ganghwensis]
MFRVLLMCLLTYCIQAKALASITDVDFNVELLSVPVSDTPRIKSFSWAPNKIVLGEETTFNWNIENVDFCINKFNENRSGFGSLTITPKEIGQQITQWYCQDIAGNRFPRDNSKFLETNLVVVDPAKAIPEIRRFEWVPAQVLPGQESIFYWEVEYLKNCKNYYSEPRESAGSISITHNEIGNYTSKWYCEDLFGNRYPEDSSKYIEATIEVVDPAKAIPDSEMFKWVPNQVLPNQEATLHWQFNYLKNCKNFYNEERKTSGTITITREEEGLYLSKWYCEDLFGNRYPEDSSKYIEATIEVVDPAKAIPEVKQFNWIPSQVYPNQEATLHWDFSYLKNCRNKYEEAREASGTITVKREDIGVFPSEWYCQDLMGNRYPETGYIQEPPTLTVVPAPEPQTMRFEWQPNKVIVGQPSTFYWDIKNVQNCRNQDGTPRENAGQMSITRAYSGDYRSKWVCEDLAGNSYPKEIISNLISVYKAPEKIEFRWKDDEVLLGQSVSFSWEFKNVTDCQNADGEHLDTSGTHTETPTSIGTYTFELQCIDLAGNKYPETGYFSKSVKVNPIPSPNVNRFHWQPSQVYVGQSATLVWAFENVENCENEYGESRDVQGSISITRNAPGDYSSNWVCKDLAGNRYPETGYINASVKVNPIPTPRVNRFQWNPGSVLVGKPATFYWDLDNVKNCKNSHGESRANSGSLTVTRNSPGTYSSNWYCQDLAGNRYPKSGYLSDSIKVEPSPIVAKFTWSPSTIAIGQSTSFIWDVKNVKGCTSTVSGAKAASGQIGPLTFNAAGTSTTQWYCTDLLGKRYPASGYLQATRTVTGGN